MEGIDITNITLDFAKNANLNNWKVTQVEEHDGYIMLMINGYFGFHEVDGDIKNNADRRLLFAEPFDIKIKIVGNRIVGTEWIGVQGST